MNRCTRTPHPPRIFAAVGVGKRPLGRARNSPNPETFDMPRNSKADKSKEQLLAELARLLDEDADLRARAVDWLQAKAEEEEAQGKPGQILGYLTVQQAAADLGIHPHTIRSWVREGKLPGYTIGKRLYVKVAELQAMVQPWEPGEQVGLPKGLL